MRIAVAQTAMSSDVRINGQHIRAAMTQAADAGARLIHFAEGALSGYVKSQLKSWDAQDWNAVAEELSATAALAKALGIWAIVGCNHPLPEPFLPQNSLYVISDEGAFVARYSKRRCSHTEVTSWYTPGVHPVTFEVDGMKFGCALCIEIVFPELFAEYEEFNVDCVLLSTYGCDVVQRVMARAHAATNCCWLSVAVTEQQGNGLPSMIVGPDGHSLAEGRAGAPDLVIAAIDPSAPQFEVALQYARPWRKLAKSGHIYRHRQD